MDAKKRLNVYDTMDMHGLRDEYVKMTEELCVMQARINMVKRVIDERVRHGLKDVSMDIQETVVVRLPYVNKAYIIREVENRMDDTGDMR